MITIIDYGMGNLRSVQKAFEHVGAKATITSKADDIVKAQAVVLPGVGAMQPAMDKLTSLNLIESIRKFIKTNRPFLGICLGLQLLFEESSEGGRSEGLGILKGAVERFNAQKVPQIGWNQLNFKANGNPLFKGLGKGPFVYFCHSYYAKPADKKIVAATSFYGVEFASAITQGNIFALQFHPEKSQEVGLKILRNFSEMIK